MSLITQWLESLADKIEINDQCLREISPFSKCEQCIQVCPEDALELKHGKIVVHENNCTACGKCMTTCPAYAIEGTVPIREVNKQTLIYKNELAPSVREWLFYYDKGVRFVASTSSEVNEQWMNSLDEVNQYLKQMELPQIVITDEIPQKEEKGYTRRQLFQQFSKESKSVFMKSLTPAKWRFNNAAFSLNRAFPDWSFYQITIDETNCNLCEVCFKVCPQHVFSMEETELLIDQSKCTGCGLCTDICQENAITITEHIQSKKVDNIQLFENTCPSCRMNNKSWHEEAEECFVCKKRKDLFYLK